MKQIWAHKPILVCRSSFFRKEFAENRKEIRLEERWQIVKTVLEFIYLGCSEVDISPIARELLAFAFKYELNDLANLCVQHYMVCISGSNVVDVVVLLHARALSSKVDRYSCEMLYRHCVPVIKENAHRFSPEDWDKLQQNPALLKQLLTDCCMKKWKE